MALFNFGKKSKETPVTESKSENTPTPQPAQAEGAAVKVLGSGCAKCAQLEAATLEALRELGMDTAIDHVTDFAQIAAYGVMSTPALVVDGRLLSHGKVLRKDEVVALLRRARQ